MHTVISKDGTKIVYDKLGNGPSLILIGGAFSYRKFPGMVKLARLLSDQFTVYTYDRRGRGDSGDSKYYEPAREYEDLDAIITKAGGTAFVWGLSSGAVLVLQAAAHGASIAKLALHEPPFIVNDTDHVPPTDFSKKVSDLVAADLIADTIKYFMTKGMGAPSFVVTMMRMMPGVWSKLMAVAHTLPYDATLLEGYMEGKSLPEDLWNNVTVPTLVLKGTESPLMLRDGADALVKVLPNAELISKKGLGHTKQLNVKRISSELVLFFSAV